MHEYVQGGLLAARDQLADFLLALLGSKQARLGITIINQPQARVFLATIKPLEHIAWHRCIGNAHQNSSAGNRDSHYCLLRSGKKTWFLPHAGSMRKLWIHHNRNGFCM